jgi:nucleoside-triphosphatase
MGTALLITGPPGIGKTSLIKSLLGEISCAAGGFLTEEIREGEERVGFRVTALDGSAATLAHTRGIRGPRVGRYQVDVPAFEAVGVRAMEAALREADLVVVDEIGKMELCSPRFVEALEACLHSPKTLLGTILQAPHPWLDAVKRRPTVELYRLTTKNRTHLQEALAARLQTEVRPR